MKNSRKIALTGMLCALAVVFMLMGGIIPLATFCCPALAGLMLLPVFIECGEKTAYGAYIAIALLSLMLSPDKESALLFVFLGYYPVLKWRIDQLRSGFLRVLVRLGVFNVAVGIMYALILYVLKLDQVMQEYAEMGTAILIACLLIGNVTMLLYDRMLGVMTQVYVRRLRPRLFGKNI